MTLHATCRLEELPLNEGRAFWLEGAAIGIFRLEDGVYALRDSCTHGVGRLTEGRVQRGWIECPLHNGCFDIRTGRARTPPVTTAVATYPVTVAGGVVYIDVE
jgi:nitrite reductase/ring-hydroxylating ferredoxin subunit